MTTTAEKIKVMQAFDRWKNEGFDQPAIIQKTPRANSDWEDVGYEPQWNWEAFEYRIKPPAPEPLECWVNVYSSSVLQLLYESVGEAQENAYKNAIRTAVHLREVTPQDEQDRKDARRYRKAKEISRTTTALDVIVSQWDQIIDKAMNED